MTQRARERSDAVVIDAVRTPIGKRGGQLSGIHAVDLLAGVLRGLIERTAIAPDDIDDVICGCVSQTGEQSTNIGRNGCLAAGLPVTVPATTIDRQCGSSQQAIHFAAQGVLAGSYEVAIACGVESMSRVPMGSNRDGGDPFASRGIAEHYPSSFIPQGNSAELMAERWGLTRTELDEFSMRSHTRAAAAQHEGRFASEVVAIALPESTVTHDEGIRETDARQMANLPPVFKPDGVVTAGNSSQISDGAAAVLITSREAAHTMGLRGRARIVSLAVCGDDPTLLSGPIPATRQALRRAGLALEEMNLIEVNEAFASVVLAWQAELGVPEDWFDARVNVNGGAIALGHPLGASGARLTATLLNELERRGGRYGLQTLCEYGGMANAMILEIVP